jgi:hypothetical protein
MALFTDGQLNALIDLQKYENRILDVANTEGIDLGGKLALAQDEVANELLMFLLKRLQYPDSPWLAQPGMRQKIGVSDVVATKPLRQWHAYKTLAFVYRDAYNNQLNDRYQGKWTEYEQLAKTSLQNYFRIGVGMVAGPIPKACTPLLSAIAGNGLASTYYVAVAWVNQAGQEGSPSDVVQITTLGDQDLVVTAVKPAVNASGWNVYAGEAPNELSLQSTTPVGIGSAWVMTTELSAGAQPGDGQQPNWYLMDHHSIERG